MTEGDIGIHRADTLISRSCRASANTMQRMDRSGGWALQATGARTKCDARAQ